MGDPDRVRKMAAKVFGAAPSITTYDGQLAMMAEGRLFVWDQGASCLRMLLSVPRPTGGVDLVVVPGMVTDRVGLGHAIRAADRLFRGAATWPTPAAGWGVEAEDLFVKICRRLGFEDAVMAPESAFTVRHATPREDACRKSDVVLTVPCRSNETRRLEVAIQLTVSSSTKNTAVLRGRKVVLVAFNRFLARADIEGCLRAAADGDEVELWFVAQVVKGALGYYLGYPVVLALEPAWAPFYLKRLLFERYVRMLAPEVRAEVRAILGRNHESRVARFEALTGCLEAYQAAGKLVVQPELFAV